MRGESYSNNGTAVYGEVNSLSGTTYAGRFKSDSSSGYAGYFEGGGNDAVYIENTSDGRGMRVVSLEDTAIWAISISGFAGVHARSDSGTGRALYGEAAATSGVNYGVYGRSNSSSGFDFYAGGAGTNYGSSSSRRWKQNITPIGDPLGKIAQLRGVYYDWDEAHGGGHDVGMIAEEVGAVMPEIVQYEANGIDAIGMDYSKMSPLLVEAVNALREKVNAQREENDKLRAANAALELRLLQLEAAVFGNKE